MDLINSEIGDIIYEKSTNTTIESGKLTFDEIRRQNKNLVILYNDDRVSKGRHF